MGEFLLVFEFAMNHFCLDLVWSRLGEENGFSNLNHGSIMTEPLAESTLFFVKLKIVVNCFISTTYATGPRQFCNRLEFNELVP